LSFNLCPELLLQLVKERHSGRGAFVHAGDERIEFNIHTYADNVILILERSGSVREMLSILDACVQ
jgi:hypothetical protein